MPPSPPPPPIPPSSSNQSSSSDPPTQEDPSPILPMPLASGGTAPPPPIVGFGNTATGSSSSSTSPNSSLTGNKKKKSSKGGSHRHGPLKPSSTHNKKDDDDDDEAYGEGEELSSSGSDDDDSSFSEVDSADEEYNDNSESDEERGGGYSRSRSKASSKQGNFMHQFVGGGMPGASPSMMMGGQPYSYGGGGVAPIRLGGPSMPYGTVANGNVAVSYVQYVGPDGRPYYVPRFQTMPSGAGGMPPPTGNIPIPPMSTGNIPTGNIPIATMPIAPMVAAPMQSTNAMPSTAMQSSNNPNPLPSAAPIDPNPMPSPNNPLPPNSASANAGPEAAPSTAPSQSPNTAAQSTQSPIAAPQSSAQTQNPSSSSQSSAPAQSPQLMGILNDIAALAPEKQAEVINQIVTQHAQTNNLSSEQAQNTRNALQRLVYERTVARMQAQQNSFPMFYAPVAATAAGNPQYAQPFYPGVVPIQQQPIMMNNHSVGGATASSSQRPANAAFFAPPRNAAAYQPPPLSQRSMGNNSSGRKESTASSVDQQETGPRPKRAATKNVKYRFEEDEEEEDQEEEENESPVASSSNKKTSNSSSEEQQQQQKPKKSKESSTTTSSLPTEEDNIDKILSYRRTPDGEEFLVKFHGKSYIHTEWVPRSRISGTPMGTTRIKRFMPKYLAAQQQKSLFPPPPPFPPKFTFVERIIGEWTSDEGIPFYLVKWAELAYEFVTWETLTDLKGKAQNTQPALDEYFASKSPSILKQTPFIRPSPAAWTSLPESPIYKDGHELRKYQLEGLNWLTYCWFNRQSCIIADEMGLGKTIQTVSFLDLLYNKFKLPGPFLVVVPLSTIPHWEREFHGWTSLRTITYHGTAPSRDVMFEYEFFYRDSKGVPINGLYKFDVLITTYEMANSPTGTIHLKAIPWRVGIFDEAHRLKNKASKSAEVLSSFRIEHKVLATGTPIQNSLDELFALLNFMEPSRFTDHDAFISQYGKLKAGEDVERLQKILRPIMLRRLKEDVEKSIPVKEETIIEVELTSIQKRLYRAILEKNLAYLTKGGKGTNVGNLMNTMMELRKCCIHPYLIKGAEDQIVQEAKASSLEEQYNLMINACGKLVLLDKLLKKLREGDHKVLIFSQMTKCLDLLEDYLKYRQYHFERIDGTIRGDLRQAAIDRFSLGGPDSFVFLLCTRAGGVGINLTSADTVVIFDSDWNPQNDLQAQARCHRIGQKKSVKVYRLITRGTYEREMFDRAGMKLGLDKAVLQSMESSSGKATSDSMLTENSSLSTASGPDRKQVETLLKKGAYGVLMDNDEDALQFCAEDIDQILERRTTIVRHEGEGGNATGGEGCGANGTSIFSKASFSLPETADNNVDLDDPNFWENWAKKLCVDDPRTLQQTLAVDEPRMKRHYKRIKACPFLEGLPSEAIANLPLPIDQNQYSSAANQYALKVHERRALIQDFLTFGLINPHHSLPSATAAGLDQNELLAYARALVRYCLEAVHPADTDSKFKLDMEKTLLGAIPSTSTCVPSCPTGMNQPSTDSVLEQQPCSFTKDEIPFPNATAPQCYKFSSWLRSSACPDRELLGWIQGNAYSLLIRLLILEFLRQIWEYFGGKSHLQSLVADASLFSTSDDNAPRYEGIIDEERDRAFRKAIISLHKRYQTESKIQAQIGGGGFNNNNFNHHSLSKRRRFHAADSSEANRGGLGAARPSLSMQSLNAVPVGALQGGGGKGELGKEDAENLDLWLAFPYREAFQVQVQRWGLPSCVPRDWETHWKKGEGKEESKKEESKKEESKKEESKHVEKESKKEESKNASSKFINNSSTDNPLASCSNSELDAICPGFLIAQALDDSTVKSSSSSNEEAHPSNAASKPPSLPKKQSKTPSSDGSGSSSDDDENNNEISSSPSKLILLAIQTFDTLRLDILPRMSLLLGEGAVRVRKAHGMPRWWDPMRHDPCLVQTLALHGWNPEAISQDPEFKAVFKRKRLPELSFVARRMEAVADALAKATARSAAWAGEGSSSSNENAFRQRRSRRKYEQLEEADEDEESFDDEFVVLEDEEASNHQFSASAAASNRRKRRGEGVEVNQEIVGRSRKSRSSSCKIDAADEEEQLEGEGEEEAVQTSEEDQSLEDEPLAVRIRLYADGVIELVEHQSL